MAIHDPGTHRWRRTEGIPLRRASFQQAIATRLAPPPCEGILVLPADQPRLERTTLDDPLVFHVV